MRPEQTGLSLSIQRDGNVPQPARGRPGGAALALEVVFLEQLCQSSPSGPDAPRNHSEGVNESRVAEQTVQGCAIEAQSAAIARAMASICNDEGVHLGGMSGHVGFVHTFSGKSRSLDSTRHTSTWSLCST